MKRNGFSLIEILITTAIISILVIVAVIIYSEVQKGVRDSRRKQDLRSIQAALEIYYQKNGRYPCTGSLSTSWLTSNDSNWITDSAVGGDCGGRNFDSSYIDILPKDPKNSDPPGNQPWVQNKFSYAYWAGDTRLTVPSCQLIAGQYYILMTKLEKDTDPEITRFKAYNYCDGTPGPTEVIGVDIVPFNGYDLDKLFIITSQE